jgi:hypothetical protein
MRMKAGWHRSLVLVLCCLCGPFIEQGLAQSEGPLGLSWGSSPDQVRQLGVKLESVAMRDFGQTYLASELPRVLSDQKTTILSFGHDGKLWRIAVLSRKFENDPMGFKVKARYDELRQALEEKYGRPKSTHMLGDSIYREDQYFLAGIRGGKSFWFSSYEPKDVSVELGIIAEDSSTAQWRLIFEDKKLRHDFEASKKALEKKTL